MDQKRVELIIKGNPKLAGELLFIGVDADLISQFN
jgi:hypothetical protein